MYQKRKYIENVLIMLLDLLCVILSGGVAFWCRYHVFYGRFSASDERWQIFMLCILFFLVSVFGNFNRHFFQRGIFQEIISILKSEVVLGLAWVLSMFIMRRTDELARLVFIYFFITNTVLMLLVHQALKLCMIKIYKYSRYSSRLLLVTTSPLVRDMVNNLRSQKEWSWVLKGIVLLDRDTTQDWIDRFPVVAGADDWMEYVVHNDIDEVFIAYPGGTHMAEMKEWIQKLEGMGIVVDVNIEEFSLFASGSKQLSRVGRYAVVTNVRNEVALRDTIAKRVLDIVGSLVGLVILGIATIFVAPAIKLESKGPVFFKQTRIGKNGRRFEFYKFRSMYQDAEERKAELLEQNEMQGLMFKMEQDPRITKVGRFLRRTSIDELPQFWNVFKGDMSLVGTRPPTEDEFVQYEAKHKCRLSMTPGMTGMWQVSGRSNITDFDEVVELDMAYIDDWNIWKDIKILLMTVKIVILGRGSH